jgi:hypothetical protein
MEWNEKKRSELECHYMELKEMASNDMEENGSEMK